MIICAKHLMTGDGRTVLEDKAVLTGADGKIKRIAPKAPGRSGRKSESRSATGLSG